ncbi:hypothetical protein EDC17_10473 [Sphingobacterium alimentarium]|uniref:Uncharacterized protein n=1 Tax=Sphingobacterium alimentarium TaxID=797292 RepID=A0A4R3VR11_9SPHI|nr:hypothetical protein [Sphingobacterium alimentarium]TCV08202.1 hypothetical protein EDC17_10473 [Sphingobacterium alimentarium]
MYVLSSAKKFTCKNCKNNILVDEIYKVYQQLLKGYLHDLQPEMYVGELESVLKEKEKLFSETKKKRVQLRKKMDELVPLRSELDKELFGELYQPLVDQVKQLDKSTPELQAEIDLKRIQIASSDYVLKEAKMLYNQWSEMCFRQKTGYC